MSEGPDTKRFTETEKWRDPWYRKLPPRLKCLWQYICDSCCPAGTFELDWELASFVIGESVSEDDLVGFGARIVLLPSGKRLVVKFVAFQYGSLSKECRAHDPVFKALDRHSIPYPYPIDRVSGRVEDTLKEKEKEKEKEGGSVEGGIRTFMLEIGNHFNRPPTSTWSCEEQQAACSVFKREASMLEWSEILQYRETSKSDGFARQSVISLLNNWTSELDKARNYDPRNSTRKNGKQSFDRNAGTLNAGNSQDYNLEAIQKRRALRDVQRPEAGASV
jgi:hypothetical protein